MCTWGEAEPLELAIIDEHKIYSIMKTMRHKCNLLVEISI